MKNIIFKKFFTDSLPILPFLCRLYGNYSPFSKGSTSLLRRRDFFIAQNPPFRVLAVSIVRDRHLWTAFFKKGGININLKTLFLKKVFASTLLATMVMFYISAFFVVPTDVEAQVDVSKTTGSTATEKKTPCVSSKDEYCLLEPLVVGGVSKPSVNIATYLKEMFKIGIGLAGVFAVFMIIWGGFQYMSTDAVRGKSEGKEKIEGALWGLGLALGSFLILNTINPQLLEFSGGLEPIKTEELAKRIQYVDPYLENNRKLDAVRAALDECNKKAEDLRLSGDEVAANNAKLKCKTNVARDSVLAKAESVSIKNDVFQFFSKDTSKEDAETIKNIIDGGKRNTERNYNEAILKLEKERSEIEQSDEPDGAMEITSNIDLLKTQKAIDLTKLDQEYDIQKALTAASRFYVPGGTTNQKALEENIRNVKRDVSKRSNEVYNKFLKTYPAEAEAIRAYTSERIKKIDEAYQKGLDRERALTNAQVSSNP